jgi:hypothetical protein
MYITSIHIITEKVADKGAENQKPIEVSHTIFPANDVTAFKRKAMRFHERLADAISLLRGE